MSENAQLKVHSGTDIPIIFVSKVSVIKPRREMAEKMISSLLQNEKFLQTLQENET